MKDIRFIARADDGGSSHAANRAIAGAIRAGFIKNVSLMAPGTFIEEAAGLMAGRKKVCFGLHATLNAEWDKVKWKPILPVEKCAGLVDRDGYFLADPVMFDQSVPPVETVMTEIAAQLDKLAGLGFAVSYIDSHMFAEAHIPGMDEAMADFAKRKGLIDHMYYYRLPPGWETMGGDLRGFLRKLASGQYFFAAHPAIYGEEMLRTGNARFSGAAVAAGRGAEAKMVGNRLLAPALRLAYGVRTVRYDEATPSDRRMTVADIVRTME